MSKLQSYLHVISPFLSLLLNCPIFLHLKKNAQKENETEEANSEQAAPQISSYCIHSWMRCVLIFKETIAVSPVFLQAGCLWLALTLIHILLLGTIPLLPSPLSLWHSLSCRLSLSHCFPVLGAGSMASICLSCVHALFLWCLDVLKLFLPFSITPQTSSQLISVRNTMTDIVVVMWPGLIIWHQFSYQCLPVLSIYFERLRAVLQTNLSPAFRAKFSWDILAQVFQRAWKYDSAYLN